MKTITKILLTVLALLIAAAPVSVFAADSTLSKRDDGQSIDVQAKYVDGVESPDSYSIDVTWGAMQFTYSTSGTRKWDPSKHEYRDNVTSGWAANGNTVTVTNHSNRAVNVMFAYEAAPGFDGIKGTFSIASDTLSAGVEGDVAGADSVSTTLMLSGSLASDVTQFTKVGSVTVSLQ